MSQYIRARLDGGSGIEYEIRPTFTEEFARSGAKGVVNMVSQSQEGAVALVRQGMMPELKSEVSL